MITTVHLWNLYAISFFVIILFEYSFNIKQALTTYFSFEGVILYFIYTYVIYSIGLLFAIIVQALFLLVKKIQRKELQIKNDILLTNHTYAQIYNIAFIYNAALITGSIFIIRGSDPDFELVYVNIFYLIYILCFPYVFCLYILLLLQAIKTMKKHLNIINI